MVDTAPLPSSALAVNSRKNDIFIAYSVEDIGFVKKLDTAIRGLGRNPWIDLEDLPMNRTPEEEWQCIQAGVDEVDVFVFVISPASLTSPGDLAELALAGQLQKPIIPVVCRPVETELVPELLQDQDAWVWINLNHTPDPFTLLTARIAHVHVYERLRAKASEWEGSGRDPNLLLYKSDLESVKGWTEKSASYSLQLTPLQGEYYQASLTAAAKHLLPRRPDVFISYSRRDKAFVERLCHGLKVSGVNLWVDWENIPVAADWREELEEGIKSAHNFLFIMSSESVDSKYCKEEIQQAAAYGKRIITLVLRKDYDREQVLPVVKERNWLYYEQYEHNLDALVSELRDTLKRDEKYVKAHTTLLLQASEWIEHKCSEELLLRGAKLKEATQWLAQSEAGEKAPAPTPEQRDLIRASLQHRHRTRVVRGLIGGLATVGLAGFLTVTAFKTLGEIRALVSSLENKQELDALMVSLQAGKDLATPGFGGLLGKLGPGARVQVVTALHQSIYGLSEHNRLEMHQGRVYRVGFMGETPAGLGTDQVSTQKSRLLVSAGQDGLIRLMDANGIPSNIPLSGHQKDVVALDFFSAPEQLASEGYDSQRKLWLASASYDGNIKLWEISQTTDGTPQWRIFKTLIHSEQERVLNVRFSPNGRWIASASTDGTIKIWTRIGRRANTPVAILNVGKAVYSLSFSPDSKTLASASMEGVHLWSGKHFTQKRRLSGSLPNSSWVSFSPNGQRLVASGFRDKDIKLWRADGSLVASLTGHEDGIYRAEFSPDSQVLASASRDNTVRIWNAQNGQGLRTLRGHQGEVSRVQFSHDSRLLASGGLDDTIKLWKPKETIQPTEANQATDQATVRFWSQEQPDILLNTLAGHRNEILDLAFSQDGTLASASADGTVRLWQTNNEAVVRLPNSWPVFDVIYGQNSPDSPFIVSGSLQDISFWQPDGKQIAVIENAHDSEVTSLSLNPQSNLLVSREAKGKVKLWSLRWAEGKLQVPEELLPLPVAEQMPHLSQASNVSSVSFSPDGSLIATTGEDTMGEDSVNLWQPDGKWLRTLQEKHGGTPTSVSFSPNGQLLASASRRVSPKAGGEILLWDGQGKPLQRITSFKERFKAEQPLGDIESVSFSPDGQWLAAADGQDNSIKLWRVRSTNGALQLEAVKSLEGHRAPVLKLRYSPLKEEEDYLLASASQDGTVKLWNKQGTLITTFRKHKREVSSVSFSPDGKKLASASHDRSVLLYPLPAGFTNEALSDLLAESCQKLEDYLNAQLADAQSVNRTDPETQSRVRQTKNFCDQKVP